VILRLTLLARITLLIIVSLAAVWIGAIAAYYWSHAAATDSWQPAPGRIAAMARLLETSSPAQQVELLQATTTNFFQPKLFAAGAAPLELAGRPVSEAIRQPYAQALDGRRLRLHSHIVSSHRRLGTWRPRGADTLEFDIGLRTGATLVIDSHGPVAISEFGLPLGFGAGLFGTVVAVLALLVMQRETKPLGRLAAAADRVDLSGEPVVLVEARRSAPEIRALVSAFNRLQMRLGSMLRARLALIGGISHDVRTFATRLRLRIDSIPDELERQRAAADIEDMIRLLDDALLSSRAGAGELTQELLELGSLVAVEVEDRKTQGASITLAKTTAGGQTSVLGDRLALWRVIANIIDNALKYGGVAHVQIRCTGKEVHLIVDDEGTGIPESQRDLMLEPFSRLDASRSRGTGGAGLGLAIARNLTEAQGGSIAIHQAPGGGARLILTLPIFQPSSGMD
jgi:signal transduction histidine kinase